MKFMIIRKADVATEAGEMPTDELLTAMGPYNEMLANAGVMRDGTGLRPSSDGARIRFSNGKPVVIDGPFAETRERLAGFYMLEARDLNEAIQLAGKIPPARYGSIEVRPVRELKAEGNLAGGQSV